jgi:8-oxo-dGTP pyrophosphatase MutT (NUDIX family)
MDLITSDNKAYRFPVSMKGILLVDEKIPLLKNERDEYELPGGKLELNETPEICLAREIQEELNIFVSIQEIIDAWLYHINNDTHVVIITYSCITNAKQLDLMLSHEHKELTLFDPKEIPFINMPEGYKNSIQKFMRGW